MPAIKTPSLPQTSPLFDQIDTWIEELQEVKAAAAPKPAKKAGAVKSAVEGMGKTTHPSEKVENNTHDAPEGARAKENISDVDKDVQGDAITGESPIKADEDKVMPNIGVDQSATGEDKSIETSSVKGDKDDPGTSHPANAEDVGQKYAAMAIPELLKAAEDKANSLLAHLAHGHFGDPAAATKTPQQPRKQAGAPAQPAKPQSVLPEAASEKDLSKAAAAGYAQAALAAGWTPEMLEKAAADFVESTMRDADFDADLVGSYLTGYRQKRAMDDEAGEGEDHKPGDGDGGGAGGAPPGGDALPPPGAGMAGPGGMPPGPGPGGPPPGPGPAGADPLAALGAATAGATPHPAGAGGDKTQAIQDLIMALHELGLTEEDLAQLSQSGPKPEEGAKMASAALAYKRSGKFRFTEAKTAQEKASRDKIREYVMEVAGLQ